MHLLNAVLEMRDLLSLKEGVDAQSWKRVRSDVNSGLIASGLDGNTSFASVGKGLMAVGEILAKNGLEWDETMNASLFKGAKGHRTLRIAFSNEKDAFSPEAIDNAMIVVQWYQHQSGNFEVVAYLS